MKVRKPWVRRTIMFLVLFVVLTKITGQSESASTKKPSSTPTIASKPEQILDAMKVDFPRWGQATDPSLAKIDGQWWMFFNSINVPDGIRIHIIAASLPKGAGLDSPPSAWQILRKDGAISPIISPRDNGWDKHATETADYVRGYDATAKRWVERLYFAGWPKPTPELVDYRLSFAERAPDGSWVRRSDDIFAAKEDWERLQPNGSFIGDESVLYEPGPAGKEEQGVWHLWYQTGSSLGVSLGHATSKDGVRWENRQRLQHKVPFVAGGKNTGPFHMDVIKHRGRYVFAGWVGDPELTQQGLWLVTSTTPDGSATGDFTDWRPLVYELGGPAWYFTSDAASACHATGLFSATLAEENGRLWLFFGGTGVQPGSRADHCTDPGAHLASIGRAEIKLPLF